MRSGSVPICFAGYAALFDVMDHGRDIIRRGAFARTLAARIKPFPLLWQHNAGQQVGIIEKISEDARGLRVIGRVENTASRAAHMLNARGVSGLSFGYRARDYTTCGQTRELLAVDLFEVSLVTRPLQHGARVHLII